MSILGFFSWRRPFEDASNVQMDGCSEQSAGGILFEDSSAGGGLLKTSFHSGQCLLATTVENATTEDSSAGGGLLKPHFSGQHTSAPVNMGVG